MPGGVQMNNFTNAGNDPANTVSDDDNPVESSTQSPGLEVVDIIDAYMAKHNKDVLHHLSRLKKQKGRLTNAQVALLDGVRSAVGLGCLQQLLVFAAFAIGTALATLVIVMWIRVIQLEEEINNLESPELEPGSSFPPVIELRLAKHVVPYGGKSVFCRAFDLNYSSPAHITGFELRSVGYPYIKIDPTGKIARSIRVFLMHETELPFASKMDVLAANETDNTPDVSSLTQTNFPCGGDTSWPTVLGEADLLWHWSRRPGLSRAPTVYQLPKEVGMPLPARCRLVVQVTYDNQQSNDGLIAESSDLRSLTSRQLWEEFQPTDSSGIRLYLTTQLRPHDAIVLTAGSFDFSLPQFAKSSVTNICSVSDQGSTFRRANENSTWELHLLSISTFSNENAVSVRVDINNSDGLSLYSTDSLDATSLRRHHLHFSNGYYFSPVLDETNNELILSFGDTIRTRCFYETGQATSERKPGHFPAGYAAGEEVCLTYLLLWPATALRSPRCVVGPATSTCA